MKTLSRHILLLTLLVTVNSVHAVNYYWVRTTSGNWNSPNSWSLTSGGPPLGAPFPTTTGDVAIFDGGGVGSCGITALVNINSTTINASYPGVISNLGVTHACTGNFTISGGTYNLNNGGLPIQGTFVQTGGTFNGNSGSIQVLGNFTKSTGTFNSTIGPLDVRGNFTVGANQFNHNNGTVYFGATTSTINIVAPLSSVTFVGYANSVYTITGTLIVNATLRYQGAGGLTLNGGNIDCNGSVLLSNTSTTGGGTATVRIINAAVQQINSSVPAGQSRLPHLVVAKTGGTFGFVATVTVAGNVLYDPPGTTGCLMSHPAGAVLAMSGAAAFLTTYDATVTAGNPILTLCDLTIMTSAAVTLGSYTQIRNLLLQPLAILDVSASNHTLYVGGNWTNQSTSASSFTQRSGLVQMITGSITSAVTGGETFYDFRMENPAGSSIITLNSRLNIMHYLRDDVTTGLNQILNTASSPLMFMDNAYMFFSDPAWMTLVVTGPVMKTGNDAFSFPVGAVTASGVLSRPITMSAPGWPSEIFTAQYYYTNSDPLYSHANRPSILALSECEYWNLNRTSGFSDVFVTLSFWNFAAPSCQVVVPSELAVCHYYTPGTTWLNFWQSSNTNNSGLGTVTSSSPVTAYGIYTLGSSTINNPLPVELVNFTAEAGLNHVDLHWSTASETNNDYFVVERSQDGVEIESLDTINGNGTTSEMHEYTSVDESPHEGLSYYRIKQVDFNGDFTYSEWRSVDMQPLNNINMYPNPSDGEIHFSLPGESDITWTLTIFNLAGQIAVEHAGSKDEFRNVGLELAAGTYILQIVSVTGTYSQKLVITE